MPDVASLQVVVGVDSSAAEKGLSDLGTKVSGVGSAISTALGGAAVAAVAGLGAAFVGSVKSAADFEKGLSAISAVSGATASELEGIRATALQLGKDTSFSASEAAAGMEEMVKAGVSLKDVMGGAGKAALDLAAAGGLSVAESATIASNAMNTFGKSGTDMAHIADVIAGAANASAIDVKDFGFSLASVGAVAATIGVNFEDTAAAIAVLGQAGLKGSDAGTSLKTMLLNLSPSTKSATAAFRELGIITADGANQFFDASGKAKSLAEISQILQTSLAGLTKEQQINALQTMFGTDAVRAAAIMAKAGAEGFNDMAAAMSKVTATAVAEERLNNLWGSLEKLKGSLETAAIMIGSLFTPALKGMADGLTGFVNEGIKALELLPIAFDTLAQVFRGEDMQIETAELLSTFGLEEFGPAVHQIVADVGGAWQTLAPLFLETARTIGDVLGPALATIGRFLMDHPSLVAGLVAAWGTFVVLTTVVGWITGAIAAFGALSSAITAAGGIIGAIIAILGGPLTLVILAVAAVVGLLVVAWTENWFGIQEITAAAVAFLTEAFTGLVAFLSATWTTITAAATEAWATMTTTFTTGITAIQAAWDAGWKAVADIQAAAWNLLSPENQQRIAELTAMMTALWTALGVLWTTGTAALSATLTTWWAESLVGWDTYQKAEIAQHEANWIAVKGIWDASLAGIKDALTAAWTWLEEQTGGFFTRLGAQFTAAGETLAQIARDLGAAVGEALILGVNSKVQAMLDAVTSMVKGALDAARSMIGGASGSSGNAAWDAIAREEGVDPALLASLIQQESGGKQVARSRAGAIGLTQLMPGTAAGLGVDPYDELQNVRGGARYLKQMLDQFGDEERALIAYNAGPGGGSPGESRAYAQRVLAGRVSVPSGVAAAQGRMTPQLNQFGMTGGTLTAAEAAAFCGPAASMWFANIYGRMPDKAEAEAMARSIGWTPEWGMTGPGSQQRLNALMGVGTNVDYTPTPAEIGALAAQNVPFQLSTAGHYYQVQGGTLGGLNVGGSGIAAGGSAVMSLDQITALSGAMNGIITLAPQMGAAFTQASVEGGTAMGGLLLSTTTMADGSTIAVTQMGATITATVTDASGQVTAQYGAMAAGVTTETATMAAGVTANTNLMATGALTSVTAMEAGILTTVQTTSGTTIATVTDMSGQVTSQYATLANGATLAMGDMAAGVLTSTTDLGTGVMTTVQDMSGNYITTITDLAGNVTAQYTSLAADAAAATAEMAAGVTEEAASMGETVLSSVTDMGEGVISITTDAAGNMTATITDMAGNVTSTYSTMSTDVTGTAEEMANTVVETMEGASENIQGAVEEWGSSIGEELSSIASEAQDQAAEIGEGISAGIAEGIESGSSEVAEAVREVVEEAVEEAKDEAESDSPSKLFARELGVPIAQGVAAGIEHGSGLVADATRGLVGVPEYAAPAYGSGSGGGRTETIILKIDIGGRVAEELYVTGRELAVQRGRG